MFHCSPRKNIFQFSWDFYELLSEGIITIICCHWDGMRWEHCDCNGQFWDGTGWDLDLISRIFTSLQPHLRHSGVLGDENLRRFVSDFSQESLEEIAYKLKENFFLLIEEHIKYNFLILVPFKKHAKTYGLSSNSKFWEVLVLLYIQEVLF